MKILKNIYVVLILLSLPVTVLAQKLDEERMKRDIEVAENVLGTLIKQQFNNQRTFFPLEVKGSYQAGYGITFTLPADFTMPIVFSFSDGNDNVFISGTRNQDVIDAEPRVYGEDQEEEADREDKNTMRLKDRAREKRRMDLDSVRDAYNDKVIEAAKTFIIDYGDMLTLLKGDERIVITNQGNQPRAWVGRFFNNQQRTHLSVEGSKGDVQLFRQGKLSREAALAKLKVVNTETVAEVEPDLELLVSMFNRLYSVDLSKTFFTENNIYYERLKDFGVIYYMHVYSGVEIDYGRFRMPTVGLNDVDLETRNKKIKELYPKFEQELKENILEYGRTLKSLKDEEVLIFQVRVTKCPECRIPSTLEYTVKGEVLTNFNAGKMDRNAALNKISIKKGADQ